MGEGVLNLGVDCVSVDEIYGVGLNDGYIYGGSEPLDLMKTPVDQWPTTQEQAVARLDTDAYAFVNNDNPADRLHLREAPNRNAQSLGKFYNRTPVKMIAWEGDWAYVEIGTGEAHLYGYMMTKYLTRGGDKGVRCAFEILTPIEEIGQDGAPIYREPDDTMEEIGRFVGGDEYVIGVYGDDYPTPDGTCVRDYVHVEDLCSAHLLALRQLLDGAGSARYNLGNGNGFSVREVIDAARRISGHPIPVKQEPRRAGDPPSLVADSSAARNALGWQPRYPELDTIVAHAWACEQRIAADLG